MYVHLKHYTCIILPLHQIKIVKTNAASMGGMVHVYGRDGNLTLFSLTAVSSLSQFFHYCVFFCYLSKWECKKVCDPGAQNLAGVYL